MLFAYDFVTIIISSIIISTIVITRYFWVGSVDEVILHYY